jgi:hypothetical protein
MPSVVYTSLVTIHRERGPNRVAQLPAQDELVQFGVHGAIADHYGSDLAQFGERPTTLDYLVAAAGG